MKKRYKVIHNFATYSASLYNNKTMGGGGVKEACVIYYDELLKYLDRSELTIIFFYKNYGAGESK